MVPPCRADYVLKNDPVHGIHYSLALLSALESAALDHGTGRFDEKDHEHTSLILVLVRVYRPRGLLPDRAEHLR